MLSPDSLPPSSYYDITEAICPDLSGSDAEVTDWVMKVPRCSPDDGFFQVFAMSSVENQWCAIDNNDLNLSSNNASSVAEVPYVRGTSPEAAEDDPEPCENGDELDEEFVESDCYMSDSDRERPPRRNRRRRRTSLTSKGIVKKRGTNSRDFSVRQKQILLTWWMEHFHFPRPSREELCALAKQCSLHRDKVYKWFDNQRTRYLAKHGDAPFNGASRRGRPGRCAQPLVIDARGVVGVTTVIGDHVLEELDLHMSMDPSVAMVLLSDTAEHEKVAGYLQTTGALHFQHPVAGHVLVYRPSTQQSVAEMWPSLRTRFF